MLATIISYLLTLLIYIKEYFFPNNIRDRKFTNTIGGGPGRRTFSSFTTNNDYDYFIDIELNPRICNFDLKSFLNGRQGIIARSLINISFMATQYKYHRYVINSSKIRGSCFLTNLKYFNPYSSQSQEYNYGIDIMILREDF